MLLFIRKKSTVSNHSCAAVVVSAGTVKFFVAVVAICFSFEAPAQSIYPSTINITGQFGTMKDFQFEISIGESASITTLSSNNNALVVTTGVLQTSVAYQPPVNIEATLKEEVRIYPNPAATFVEVNFVSRMVGLNQYELFDLSGKKILSGQFYYFGMPRTERLDLSKLSQGVYFLNIQQYSSVTNQVAKSGAFRIIKLK